MLSKVALRPAFYRNSSKVLFGKAISNGRIGFRFGFNSSYSTGSFNFNNNQNNNEQNKSRNELMGVTVAAVFTCGAILFIAPPKKRSNKQSIQTSVEDAKVEKLPEPVLEAVSEQTQKQRPDDLINIGELIVEDVISDSVTGEKKDFHPKEEEPSIVEKETIIVSPIATEETNSNGAPVIDIVEAIIEDDVLSDTEIEQPKLSTSDVSKSDEELVAFETEKLDETEEEAGQEGAFNPDTGEINWDCPCLGGMADGPCGEEFKEAFACFVYSDAEPKGIDCVDKFQNMQTCFRRYPEYYAEQLKDEDDAASEGEHPSQSTNPSEEIPLETPSTTSP